MSAETRIEPPTDPQLEYIASLCADRGIPLPAAVHSKTEASEIIGGILNGSYDHTRYVVVEVDDEIPF